MLSQRYQTLSIELFLEQMEPFETQEAYSVVRTLMAFCGPNFRPMLENWLQTADSTRISALAKQELECIALTKSGSCSLYNEQMITMNSTTSSSLIFVPGYGGKQQ